MKRKFIKTASSAVLAAVLCFSFSFALSASALQLPFSTSSAVTAEQDTVPSGTVVDSGEAASSVPTEGPATSPVVDGQSAENPLPLDEAAMVADSPTEPVTITQEDLDNAAAQLTDISNQMEDMANQVKKASIQATIAVAFGFAALVFGVIALMLSLRKTASASNSIQSSKNDGNAWKELSRNIKQMDQQLQRLAKKQEEVLSAAAVYMPSPVPSTQTPSPEQALHTEVPVRMSQESKAELQNLSDMPALQSMLNGSNPAVSSAIPPVSTPNKTAATITQEPQLRGYLVYKKDYKNDAVPSLEDAPAAENIQMKVMTDGTVLLNERPLQHDYESVQTMISAGIPQVFDILVNQQVISQQRLKTLGSLRLKKMKSPARIRKDLQIETRGVLEFEQMDYS